MNNSVLGKWALALASGKYKRYTEGHLRGIDLEGDLLGYSSLGVLCDLYGHEFNIEWEDTLNGYSTFLGESSLLPQEVLNWMEAPPYSLLTRELYISYKGKHRSTFSLESYFKLQFNSIAELINESIK